MMGFGEAKRLLSSQPDGTFLTLRPSVHVTGNLLTGNVIKKEHGEWVSHENGVTAVYYTDWVTERIRNPTSIWSFS